MINTKPPRRMPGFTDTREFESWMYNLFNKLGISDITFDDLVGLIPDGLTPATTVVSETLYDQIPVIGISTNYAREDHSHGTPNESEINRSLMIAYAITLG